MANNRHYIHWFTVSQGIQQWLYFDQAAGFANKVSISWSPH